MFKMEYVGSIFKTNNCGDLIIIGYINNRDVRVKFINTGYETTARLGDIKRGTVKDKLKPSVYGVGVIGEAIILDDGKLEREYRLWRSMLARCYSENTQKKQPTYVGCYVSKDFLYYPHFKEWCKTQIGFNFLDDKGNQFELDKDILIKGNKAYSPETCCFVPKEINISLTSCEKARGAHLIGVCYNKRAKKYVAMSGKSEGLRYLSYFDSEVEAFYSYKQTKELYIKSLAEKWKDQIDIRVYEVLMKWKVEMTD